MLPYSPILVYIAPAPVGAQRGDSGVGSNEVLQNNLFEIDPGPLGEEALACTDVLSKNTPQEVLPL